MLHYHGGLRGRDRSLRCRKSVPKNEDIAQDAIRAATLCSKNADLAVSGAQMDPGRRYLTGRGVPHDFVVSTRWFQDAVIQSNAKAAVRLEQQY